MNIKPIICLQFISIFIVVPETIMAQATEKNLVPVYDADGNQYNIIKIGKQYWFQQNLKTTKYRDGTAITTNLNETDWKQTREGAYAVYENLAKYGDTYGLLYNGYAVATGKLCPGGWRIPTDEDWKELEQFLGIKADELERTGERGNIAEKLKISEGWKDQAFPATNESGLSVLPGGSKLDNGDFVTLGQYGNIWSSSVYDDRYGLLYLWNRHVNYNSNEVGRIYTLATNGYSCRCVTDSVIAEVRPIITTKTIPPEIIIKSGGKEISNKKNKVTDFSNVKMCLDVEPQSKTPLPYRYPANAYTYYKINPDGSIGNVAYQQQGLSAYSELMWMPGEVVKFSVIDLNGRESSVIDTVKKYAKIWERFANIKMEYTTKSSEAQIRISFEKGKSSSYLGRYALNIESDKNTMNLGWIGGNADENRRVILHEFGHALGFIHEHNAAMANIPWDKEKVYTYYAGAPNFWSREMVDHNIFYKYSQTETNFSAYDANSIMHYPIDSALTTDGSSVPMNNDLSATDKQYAAIFYPFPATPPVATGTLKTGDDCDEIDFKIEFDAVERDKVELVLQPGINRNGKVIDWWKQVSLPLIGYKPLLIQMEGGKSSKGSVGRVHLDDAKGIGFSKAKLLGVHTELTYKWNILKAVRGGCRITLTWRNDSCL